MNRAEEDIFTTMELQTPSNTDTRVKDVIMEDTPSVLSPEWNEYVMSKFTADELVDNMPIAAGLRRVSEMLLGQIMFSGPTQVFPPKDDNSHGRATVVWKVEFADGSCFSDVADCWEGNTDDMFCAYAVATAATRAEARALRKALRIRAVAAEEVTKKNTAAIVKEASRITSTTGEYEDSSRMTDPQATFINIKCKQLDINPLLFFKEVMSVNNVQKITKKVASDSIDKLNQLQRNTSDISDSIKGYAEDWRNV